MDLNKPIEIECSSNVSQKHFSYNEENEIDMFEVVATILKYKKLICIFVLCASILSVFSSLLMNNFYRSEATLGPRESDNNVSLGALGGLGGIVASQLGIGGGGTLEKLEVVLQSRELSTRVIKKYELMPRLFDDAWYTGIKLFAYNPPTLQDGLKEIKQVFSVVPDKKKNTLSIRFDHRDPATAKEIVGYYLNELSNILREEIIEDATANMRFFREELEKTSDAMLREKLYALLAKEIEKETFAKAQKYYGFIMLDPPIVPDLDKKVKPRRAIICILSVFVAFFLAVFLSFSIEFCKKMEAADPVRFHQIVDGLKVWRFRSEKMRN